HGYTLLEYPVAGKASCTPYHTRQFLQVLSDLLPYRYATLLQLLKEISHPTEHIRTLQKHNLENISCFILGLGSTAFFNFPAFLSHQPYRGFQNLALQGCRH
ncbi:unnamed protein product, partial [Sphacelaria rigidula]